MKSRFVATALPSLFAVTLCVVLVGAAIPSTALAVTYRFDVTDPEFQVLGSFAELQAGNMQLTKPVPCVLSSKVAYWERV
jgi:hypothetical protein